MSSTSIYYVDYTIIYTIKYILCIHLYYIHVTWKKPSNIYIYTGCGWTHGGDVFSSGRERVQTSIYEVNT